MIIDSSALICLLLGEPEAEFIGRALSQTDRNAMTAATFLETAMVITNRLGDAGESALREVLAWASIEVVPVDWEITQLVLNGWRRFGRRRHPAGLNFGDCFSYALAIQRAEPLLYKGNDFSQTDVTPA